MKELYGVLGGADAPTEVIHEALDDIKTTVNYVIPWYGVKPIPPSLVAVYDWMIDNEATYEVVSASDGFSCPKALAESAKKVTKVDDPSQEIIELLEESQPTGFALIMWDEESPENSVQLAVECIQKKIPSLELTAGLAPIILDEEEDTALNSVLEIDLTDNKIDISDMPDIDPTDWDIETLNIMPASSVKRLARDAGHDVKTKADAIKALKGDPDKEVPVNDEIGTILVIMNDGTELGFSGNPKLLKEIMNLVVKHQNG